MAVKIVIDAGHGGYDAGATYNGRREKEIVQEVNGCADYMKEATGYALCKTDLCLCQVQQEILLF